MIQLKPIHQQLSTLNGQDQMSCIINVEWLLDAIVLEMKQIEDQYKQVYIPTNLKNIGIRFLFNHKTVSLNTISGQSKFEMNGFEFELELVERQGQTYGDKYASLYVSYNKTVEGSFTITSNNDFMSDISYFFEPIIPEEVSINQSTFDETVILRNFTSISDFESSLKAITLLVDYGEYVEDLFSSLPTPNVFEALGSYKIGAPYNVSVENFTVNGSSQPFIVVKGAAILDRTERCDCGEPGGVTTIDDIRRNDGDNTNSTTVSRRRVTNNTPVTDTLNGELVAGFIFPFYNKSENKYKTFLKDLTAQTSISTTITDSGKTSGVNWSYKVNASVPLSDIDIDVDYDILNQKYAIIVKMPHIVTGKINLVKKIGCGVKLRDSIELTQGRIDPFTIKLGVEFIQGRNGREVILNPETEANLYYRLRPKGIFAFLVAFFGKIIDRKLVEDRIIAISNTQIISFIKAFVIPTIPQRKIRIGATMLDESLFIALGKGNLDDDGRDGK